MQNLVLLALVGAVFYLAFWGLPAYWRAQAEKEIVDAARATKIQRKAEDKVYDREKRKFLKQHPNGNMDQFEQWLRKRGYL